MRLGKVGVVIPAAGQGKRMGADRNKQFLELCGIPVLAHTLRIFQQSDRVAEIVVVGIAEEQPALEALVRESEITKVTAIVEGGALRQDSVFAGLKALSGQVQRVVVHDGARPLLSVNGLQRFLEESDSYEAALMAIPLKDTVKIVNKDSWVMETPPRGSLRAVQTPQIFDRVLLEEAYRQAACHGYEGTDDASIVEWLGKPVKVLDGELLNIKITTPEDLWLAEIVLGQRSGQTK